MTIHVVQAGETVGSIAASYGVDPARLAADNAVPPSSALAVGQTLVSAFPARVHAVRAGETLASIAEAYGTTVRRLWQNNWPLGGQTALRPGQVLVISYFGAPTSSAAFNGYALSLHRPVPAGCGAPLSHLPGALHLRHHRRRRPAPAGG